MFKDTATKRKTMNWVSTHIRDIDESNRLKKLEQEEQAKIKATPEFKQAERRRILIRTLTVNNEKEKPNSRIENTIEFMYDTLECIWDEVNSLNHKLSDEEASSLMYKYRLHYEHLQDFDNDVEFDKEKGYTRDLQLVFLEKLAAIEPKLMNYFIKQDNAETTI